MARKALALQKERDVDVIAALDTDPHAFAAHVTHNISVKGFCLVDTSITDMQLQGVVQDISLVREEGRLRPPPDMLLEGLLGPEGSARICEANTPGFESDQRIDGDNIRECDSVMTQMGMAIAPYLQQLGIEVCSRTVGIIHEAGNPSSNDDEPVPLQEKDAASWLTTLANHKLMLIWALGPDSGTLEMQPFDDESQPQKATMRPGTMVMLRADALSHRFSSSGRAYCMTTYFLKHHTPSKHKDYSDPLTPCAQALEDWAFERIRQVKEMDEEQARHVQLPRAWESLMNQTSFVGQHINVKTAAVKMPGCHELLPWACVFTNAPDMVTEIPVLRWNHDVSYDANPESWRWGKTNCRHMSYVDGTELFDNSMFRISRSEASGMDPGHRMTMETGYEALHVDGYKTSSLINSRGGVFVANPSASEWGSAEKSNISGGVCGGGGSIACGRFSFTHGLKGPCISVDVESASSLVVVNYASSCLARVGQWDPIPFAVVSSYHLLLTPMLLVHQTAAGLLSSTGRCLSFDASANGYVRGETAVSMVLKSMTEIVDGEMVVKEEKRPAIGTLASEVINQSGKRASLTTPDGAAEHEVICEAVRLASISPLDVDVVECHTASSIISDAIEASATGRAYRPDGFNGINEAGPIILQSAKGVVANEVEAMGITQVLKVLLCSQAGISTPMSHLRLMNPHMDLDVCERPVMLGTECLEFTNSSNYSGVTNRSISGTNAHVITWGKLDDERSVPLPPPIFKREKILFWPEGGGNLEVQPRKGYFIAGSWNRWAPEPMEVEGEGVYGYTMTLGENMYERFQILLDGDFAKTLFPEEPQTGKGALVKGPQDVMRSSSWMIDARRSLPAFATEEDTLEGGIAGPRGFQRIRDMSAAEDFADPGSQYRIRYRVAGKWHTVDWEKLETDPKTATLPTASYYLVGSWNDGKPEEMIPEAEVEGLYVKEVVLPEAGGVFQIIRNEDWGQVIYPTESQATDPGVGVLGPDGEPMGRSWYLEGFPGDAFRIEFQRATEFDFDLMQVSWQKLAGAQIPSPAQVALVSQPKYFVLGSWTDGSYTNKMNFTGSYYQFFLQLGPRLRESFQILLDGLFIYPNIHDAHYEDEPSILGPERFAANSWTIGATELDKPEEGRRYEIRLFVSPEGAVTKLDWEILDSGANLEEARGRGFMAVGS